MMSTEYQTCLRFYRKCDDNGSATWAILYHKIQIVHCQNNCDLNKIVEHLNKIGYDLNLEERGCKMPFFMYLSRPRKWINDFRNFVNFN